MTSDDAGVDALHGRLRVLAERSGLPLPALDVVDDPKGRLLPATVRDGGDGQDRIAVSSSLLRSSPDAQTWHLATALGHWASPVPRRRRRQGWVVVGLVAALRIGHGLADVNGVVDLPRPASFALPTLLGLLVSLTAAAAARRSQAASDEAGREVLRRAGHDPVALTRQVFAGRPDPSWWTRLHSRTPAPGAEAPSRGSPRARQG